MNCSRCGSSIGELEELRERFRALRLTRAEAEVAVHFAVGKTTVQIAADRVRSYSTIVHQLDRALAKLMVPRSSQEVTRRALLAMLRPQHHSSSSGS